MANTVHYYNSSPGGMTGGGVGGLLGGALGTNNNFKPQEIENTFNATQAPVQNTNFADALAQSQQAALGGQGAANTTGDAQTAFADALRRQAAGEGPSLAQAQLQQATEANKASAAGTIASQRGLNPALAARSILGTQANLSQQAAGQSAMTRMQEQLNTQAMLGQALQAQRAQDINQQGALTNLYGTVGGLNLGQRGQDIGNFQTTQGFNHSTAQQNANLAMQTQEMRARIAQENAQRNAQMTGGLLGGIGSSLGQMFGGGLSNPFGGGGNNGNNTSNGTPDMSGGGSSYPAGGPMSTAGGGTDPNGAIPYGPQTDGGGGQSSPGDYNPPVDTGTAGGEPGPDDGGPTAYAFSGGSVGGRAEVPGNSIRNDHTPAMLSPGEIVIPRSITQSQDPAGGAADFVRAVQAHRTQGSDYGHVLARHAELDDRVRRLEDVAAKYGRRFDQGGSVDYSPIMNPAEQGQLQSENTEAERQADLAGIQAAGSAAAWNEIKAARAKASEDQQKVSDMTPYSDWAAQNRNLSSSPWAPPPAQPDEPAQPQNNQPPQTATPTPTSPAPVKKNTGNKTGMGNKDSIGAIEQQALDANTQKANLEQRQFDEQAEKQKQYVAQMQAMNAETQQRFQNYQDKADKSQELYAKGQIDPSRMWGSASTGQKFAAGIGIILGGIGQGLIGGPNQALQVIDKAIDRDLDAQKFNLDKQKNSTEFYLRQGHDYLQSRQLAKADLKDDFANQLEQSAMSYAGGKAQVAGLANAAAIRNQARQERAQAGVQAMDMNLKALQLAEGYQNLGYKQGQRDLQLKAASGQPLTAQEVAVLGGEKEFVNVGGGKYVKALGEESAKDVKKSQTAGRGLTSLLAEYPEKEAAVRGTGYLNPFSAARSEAANWRQRVTDRIADLLHASGRFSEERLKYFAERVPDPSSVRQEKARAELEAIERDINSEKEATEKSNLLAP